MPSSQSGFVVGTEIRREKTPQPITFQYGDETGVANCKNSKMLSSRSLLWRVSHRGGRTDVVKNPHNVALSTNIVFSPSNALLELRNAFLSQRTHGQDSELPPGNQTILFILTKG
ncbi:Hypothetical protein SMAX5B_011431 [Scophthalmus maximus]|uniref:Uncharacterized protein n=1 Tax=Scophthalmus maximus TaxID=52904 RepID=A0A2U9BMT8_SCOMX|nr:Hypothetical protein SMAX5B_011431 [Scophthalmus maximus]KAF0021669.1 hypothetical protein F2P81_026080 [Scophthalmus maximus]